MPRRIGHVSKGLEKAVGTYDSKINDGPYTKRVQERLGKSLLDILKFTDVWQMWVIDHPNEGLPEVSSADTMQPFLRDKKRDSLLRAIMAYVQSKERLTKKEKVSIRNIVTRVLDKENWSAQEIMNFLRQLRV